ncbi:MAG TPA: secondary thiamine-phosphate synthase enzyme YjbQ [Ktedonobacteraceae bacterium]|nr:secondary thiamine-phosphate synthase enzyme YjbQ [Ktedonobacteraceae bacterium]
MKPITVTVVTKQKDQVLDITDTIETHLRGAPEESGVCVVFAAHTTCALTTADLDPGTDLDLLNALRHTLPDLSYRHPHDPSHTPDHILSSLIGPSVAIPYHNGRLLLGTWQRVILVELDGPRHRTVHVAWM